jgi:four helix bundle protein
MGSLNETESLWIVAYRLALIEEQFYVETKSQMEELGRILNGLRKFLNE